MLDIQTRLYAEATVSSFNTALYVSLGACLLVSKWLSETKSETLKLFKVFVHWSFYSENSFSFVWVWYYFSFFFFSNCRWCAGSVISFIRWRFKKSAFLLLFCVFERKFLNSLKHWPLLFPIFPLFFSWGVELLEGLNLFRSVNCFFFYCFGESLRR